MLESRADSSRASRNPFGASGLCPMVWAPSAPCVCALHLVRSHGTALVLTEIHVRAVSYQETVYNGLPITYYFCVP